MTSNMPRVLRPRTATLAAVTGVLVIAGWLVAATGTAQNKPAFIDSGVSIHPACVQAVAMRAGDKIPVIRAVNLQGCMASDRAKAKPFRDGDRYGIEVEGGKFMYNHLSTLDNGLYILGLNRILADGSTRFSLGAFQIADRPTLMSGEVVKRRVLETIGEVWLNDVQRASLRTAGNVVSYSAGVGNRMVEQTIDLSRIGKASR